MHRKSLSIPFVRFCSLLLLASGLTPLAAIGSSFGAICPQPVMLANAEVQARLAARAVAGDPGPGQLIPGRYFNPNRSGQGWDFFWYGNLQEAGAPTPPDKLFVVYYSYEQSGGDWKPVWYGATADPAIGINGFETMPDGIHKKWSGILYRYKQVEFAGGGFGPIRQVDVGNGSTIPSAEKVGTVTVFFGANGYMVGQRPDQAAVEWSLTNPTYHPNAPAGIQDCLTNFLASGQSTSFPEAQYNGLWTDVSSASGWFWIPIFWRPDGASQTFEHHLVSFFDEGGNPSWILGGDNSSVCFQGTAAYPPAEPDPSEKAVCASRTKGYAPWLLVCNANNSPAGCSATWNPTQYMVRVGKLVRGAFSTTTEGVNRSTLRIVRELGVPPTGSAISNPPPLSVALQAGLPRAPFNNPSALFSSVVSQLNGLTRLRVDFESGGTTSNSDNGGVCRTNDGLCRLRLHFMTEGAHPAITLIRRRLNAGYTGTTDVAVVSTGQLRSPADGQPIPMGNTPVGAEALIVGDQFRYEAHATADTSGAPMFKTRDFSVSKSLGGSLCASTQTPPVPPVPTLAVEVATAAGQPFRISTSATMPLDTPIRGIRLRVYEASPLKLAGEQVLALNATAAINQTMVVTGLEPGRDYKAVAEVFNICAATRSTNSNTFTVAEFETPDDPQFNAAWAPAENSHGIGNSYPMAGSMPLQVEASGGAAAVSIPIEVAPGRHGMQPGLALAYSSRGGNGLAGMGWGLSGTSSIHRCPRTIDQDAGKPGGVEFSNADRLCLDGQRLVAVAGAYGAANAEYRTEVDQFLRVRQLGGDLTGTSTRFTVEYSDGQSAVYGDSTVSSNSRVTVAVNGAGTQTLSWQLARRQDGAGNSVHYFYNQAQYIGGGASPVGSGESLLTRITYTGFVDAAGASVHTGHRRVEFCYEDRPGVAPPASVNPCLAKSESVWNASGSDRSSSYLAGALVEQTQRLRAITVTDTGARVRRYELNYAAPSAYTGRSLLRDVLVCGSDGNSCLPKTVFAWNESAGPQRKFRALDELNTLLPPLGAMGAPVRPNDPYSPTHRRSLRELGDMDGDGLSESLLTDSEEPYNPISSPRSDYIVRYRADRSIGAIAPAPPGWFVDDPDPNGEYYVATPELIDRYYGLKPGTKRSVWEDLNNDGRVDSWYVQSERTGCVDSSFDFVGTNGNPSRNDLRECQVTARLRIRNYVGDGNTWNSNSFPVQTDVIVGDATRTGALVTGPSLQVRPMIDGGVVVGGPNNPFNPAVDYNGSVAILGFLDANGDGLKDLVLSRRVRGSEASACQVAGDPAEAHLGTLVVQILPNLSVPGSSEIKFGNSSIYQSCKPSANSGYDPTHASIPARFYLRRYPILDLINDLDGDGLRDLKTFNLDNKVQYRFGRLQASSTVYGWGDVRDVADALAPLASELMPNTTSEPWWDPVLQFIFPSRCDTPENSQTESCRAVNRFDVNGDGLEDLVYGRSVQAEPIQWQSLRLNTGRKGRNRTLYTDVIPLRDQAGNIGITLSTQGGARYVIPKDLDSDGRPEILTPGHFALRLCTMLYVPSGEQRIDFSDQMGSGSAAMNAGIIPVVETDPTPPLDNFYFCPGVVEHGYPKLHRGVYLHQVPVREMYQQGQGSYDSSLYFAKSYRIVDAMVNNVRQYRLMPVSTGTAADANALVTNANGETVDFFGDGLDDGFISLHCKRSLAADPDGKRCEVPTALNTECPLAGPDGSLCTGWNEKAPLGPNTLPGIAASVVDPAGTTIRDSIYGLYLSENLGTAPSPILPSGTAPPLPEMLASVSQRGSSPLSSVPPLKRWQFSYQPLSSSAGRGADEVPLYEVPSTGLRGSAQQKHFYFTSSMPVVSTYTETINGSAGTRAYQRTHSFGYREALYNNAGRGFRGFRDIIEEVDALTSSGSLLPGTRTWTRFEHYFPMSGLPSCVMTSSSLAALHQIDCAVHGASPSAYAAGAKSVPTPGIPVPGLISSEARTYSVVANAGLYTVLPSTVSVKRYEPDYSTLIGATETSLSSYDAYGHAGLKTSTTRDFAGLAEGDLVYTSVVKSLYDPQQSPWWPDRLVRTIQTSSVTDNRLPGGTSPPAQSTTTLIGYDSTTRQANCQMQFDGALETLNTAYASSCTDPGLAAWASSAKSSFDVFGNPAVITQYIKGESPRTATSQWCSGAACTANTSSEGYFPLAAFNAAGHATCSTFDARYGVAVAVRQPMTGGATCAGSTGLTTTVTLDVLGRPIKQEFPKAGSPLLSSAPPAHTARQWCVTGLCPINARHAVLREVTEQQGTPTSYRYFDAAGQVVAEASQHFDGSSLRTVYRSFDDFGRLLSESQPTFASTPEFTTEHSYDVFGRMNAKWSRRLRLDGGSGYTSLLSRYYTSGLRTDIEVQNCTGVTVPATVGDAPVCNGAYGHNLTMSRLFNSAGKVLETTDANGGDTSFVYDGGGNVVRLVDANGKATTAVYDGLGRRLSSVDPNQGARSYTYNGAGEIKSETDARGWAKSFTYDALGRVTRRDWNEQAVAPNASNLRDVGVDTFVYDTLGSGLLTRQSRTLTRQGGALLESSSEDYSVDALYRVTQSKKTIKTGSAVEDFVSTTRYDKNFGRSKQSSQPGGVSVVYRYNVRGFALGEAMLEDAANPGLYLRKVMSLDVFGNVTDVRLANGVMKRLQQADVSSGWVKRICSGTGNFSCTESTTVNNNQALDVSYRYDGFGNVSRATNAGKKSAGITLPVNETYSYDVLHRLTQNAGGLVNVEYAYDAVGNMLKKSDFSQNPIAGAAYLYQPGRPNAVSEVALKDTVAGCSAAASKALYGYDANGNQSSRQTGCAGQSNVASDWMDYSIDNLPRQIARMPGFAFGATVHAGNIPTPNNLTQFHYGSDNQRTLQVLSFDATKKRTTVYAGGYERDSYTDGRVEHRYSVAPGVMLIRSTVASRAGTYYTHQDRLGSTSTVTKADGTIISQNGFDAFGMPRSGDWDIPSWQAWTMAPTANGAGYSNPGITRRGFTDHEQLDQLGLTHMNGRMYDYRLGRFLGVDPIIQFPTNSQSLNPYSYIMNNPLSGTDPTGYAACPAGTTCEEEKRREPIPDLKESFLRKSMSSYFDLGTLSTSNGAQEKQSIGTASSGSRNTSDPKNVGAASDPKQLETIVVKPTQREILNSGDPELIRRLRNDLALDYFGGFSKIVGSGVAVAFVCGDPLTASACLAYGAGAAQAGDEEQAKMFLAAGASSGIIRALPSSPASVARPLNVSSGERAAAVEAAAMRGPSLPVRNAEGGVSFAGSRDLYPAGPGQQNTVQIQYTGSRRQDYGAANQAAGVGTTQKPPSGYTWHHVDDYNAASNTGTMQLVRLRTHEATYPHNGGVRQYEQATGNKYK